MTSTVHSMTWDPEDVIRSALGGRDVRIVERRPNPYSSRFSSEIVTIECETGQERLFCKYGVPGGIVDVHGLRSGIGYEADVYERLVERWPEQGRGYLGFATDPSSEIELLVLEFLEGFNRIAKYAPRSLPDAAAAIGAFQARGEGGAAGEPLNRYDVDYYLGWAERAEAWSRPPGMTSCELDSLLSGYAHAAETLANGPLAFVHGELYPNNVLIRGDSVRLVDWEWAAIAGGEIDLAALTEGRWDPHIVRDSVRAYCDARWGGRAPVDLERRLAAARAYLHMRSLGGRPGRAHTDATAWRWSALRRELSAFAKARGD